jgi:hypothetical protein
MLHETMTFTNPTEHTLRLDAIGLDPVGPGKDVEIPLHLAAATRTDAGQRGKSPVEQVAPQLKPKREEDHKIWSQVPPVMPAQSKVVTVTARPASEAPGVKALRDAKAAQAAQAASAQKPVASAQTSGTATAPKA